MLKTLLACVKQYKKNAILSALFSLIEVIMEVLIPFVTASIIDKGIQEKNISAVVFYSSIMVVMAFVSLWSGIQAGKNASIASAGFASNIRSSMYEKIQTYSFSNIDKFSTASLITRLTTDVTNIQFAFQMIIRIAVRAPFMIIISLIMCMLISVDMSMIFLVAMIFLATAMFIIAKLAMPIFEKLFEKYDELNLSVEENITGIRVVKSFAREDFESEKFGVASHNLYKLGKNAEVLLALNNPFMMFAIYGSIVCISWFGAKHIVSGTLTTGQLTSLFAYVMGIMISLMIVSMIFVMVTMSMADAKRVCEVLDEEQDIKNPINPIYDVKDGSIRFENVSFGYGNGEYSLTNINLNIEKGQMIGLVSGTGQGKSSLVNLLSRLYDVNEGKVYVGGIDVREYDLNTLRDKVAVVLQKNVLFAGTIAENLRWGNENATLQQIKEACEIAGARDFVENFEKQYDTYIEQYGANVSGGQKQRLCIARALLKDPKILILDDSTSAVDTATDKKIRDNLKNRLTDLTKIIISQRISSVKDCDKIIVLKNGKLDAFDTHDNLLKSNAIYKEMYQMQSEDGGDFDEQ